MEDALATNALLNRTERCLVGADPYMSIRSRASALFKPSTVLHPDQSGALPNGCRFILSLRAVGEGDISSLTSDWQALCGGINQNRSDRAASQCTTVASKVSRSDGDDVEATFADGQD